MNLSENSRYLGEERINRLMLKFSIPCILSLLVSSLYNIVDQIFIGNSELGYLGNAATETAGGEANTPGLIKRNVIGGTNWKAAGEWIEYTVNAPADGLYCLTFKYR